MSTIEDVEYLDSKKFNYKKSISKKSQILLFDTQRRFDDYYNKLIYRNNGEYDDIPHYIINKLGNIYNLFDTKYFSKTFDKNSLDKKIIKIALENLGWLNKNTITGVLNNWIDDIYRGEPHIKNWRNKFYWDTYTDVQLKSLTHLCEYLCDKHQIKKQIISSQGFINKPEKHEGIIYKSNFSIFYTDINPSFDSKIFERFEIVI